MFKNNFSLRRHFKDFPILLFSYELNFVQLLEYVVRQKKTVVSLARALMLVPGAINVLAKMDMLVMERLVKVDNNIQ